MNPSKTEKIPDYVLLEEWAKEYDKAKAEMDRKIEEAQNYAQELKEENERLRREAGMKKARMTEQKYREEINKYKKTCKRMYKDMAYWRDMYFALLRKNERENG